MHVFFLTEAGPEIGTGHVVRCEAVAQAICEDWGSCSFIIDSPPDFIEPGFNTFYFNWKQDKQELKAVLELADAIVADSYHLNGSLIKFLDSFEIPLFLIDDQGIYDVEESVVINPSVNASSNMYKKRGEHNTYAGVHYMPLRRDFWDLESLPYLQREGVLVTLGGSDMQDILQTVVDALDGFSDPVTVISSGYNLNEKTANVISSRQNAGEMKKHIQKSRFIVCAGGGTLLEAARCGTPAVVIKLADNQDINIAEWSRLGFARYAGQKEDTRLGVNIAEALKKLKDHIVWRKASHAGTALVDGQGARRIAGIIQSVAGGKRSAMLKQSHEISGLFLKNFTDCPGSEYDDMLTARNANEVRLTSMSRNKLTPEQFRSFIKSLSSSETSGYWRVMRGARALGVFSLTSVNFEEGSATLGYYKDHFCREGHVGRVLVELAKGIAFQVLGLRRLNAETFEDNVASSKSLEICGFKHIDTKKVEISGDIAVIKVYELVNAVNPE